MRFNMFFYYKLNLQKIVEHVILHDKCSTHNAVIPFDI